MKHRVNVTPTTLFGLTPEQCKHADAYRIFRYETIDGETGEYLWNARDAQAPGKIPTRDRKSMMYIRRGDLGEAFEPGWNPNEGERIIVDMSPEMAAASVNHLLNSRPNILALWIKSGKSIEMGRAALIATLLRDGHEPAVITVQSATSRVVNLPEKQDGKPN